MVKLKNNGFSLIEVLIAAAVVGLSLFAVIVMVRKGQELLLLNKHRSEARGIIERTLENSSFDPENYKSLVTKTNPAPQDVIIDSKAGLHGTLTDTVKAEQNQTGVDPLTLIPFREIVLTISWPENSSGTGTYTETVSVRKRLSNVQRE